MGIVKPPSAPSVPMPPPAAHPAILGASTVDTTLKAQKARAQSSVYTANQTIGTSPQGLKTQPTTAKATLLGQ